jgi:hypothetical protein
LSESATKRNDGNSVTQVKRLMERHQMNSIIYLVGLVVVILAILSFFGLR